MTREQLQDKARTLIAQRGSQERVAAELGISQPRISMALNFTEEDWSRDRLLMAIVEGLTGKTVTMEVKYRINGGRLVSRDDLRKRARKTIEQQGTITDAAGKLGVARNTLSSALTSTKDNRDGRLVEIVEKLGGASVEKVRQFQVQ